MASQTKVLHLLGAQDFQSRFHGSKPTDPAKKALYADLECACSFIKKNLFLSDLILSVTEEVNILNILCLLCAFMSPYKTI